MGEWGRGGRVRGIQGLQFFWDVGFGVFGRLVKNIFSGLWGGSNSKDPGSRAWLGFGVSSEPAGKPERRP